MNVVVFVFHTLRMNNVGGCATRTIACMTSLVKTKEVETTLVLKEPTVP